MQVNKIYGKKIVLKQGIKITDNELYIEVNMNG